MKTALRLCRASRAGKNAPRNTSQQEERRQSAGAAFMATVAQDRIVIQPTLDRNGTHLDVP
jgi:hypothetical protein